MVLEGGDGSLGGIAEMYVWGYNMVSALPVFLNDKFVFGTDFFIKNLEVNLVAL